GPTRDGSVSTSMAPLIWIAWNQSSVSIQPSTAIR
ncbi:MAG: hypothetical protein, partial [Olavius algarvensis Gamma 1 endosymbiont]